MKVSLMGCRHKNAQNRKENSRLFCSSFDICRTVLDNLSICGHGCVCVCLVFVAFSGQFLIRTNCPFGYQGLVLIWCKTSFG